ncbi:excitatory amino acid transporter-like [Mizuhopecten yessoensis]|uniref:excitatory amino acid transporter-like n=1 Tax=Mizuhopecten yessoensis TaxID=6573 RepID=UPI000B45D6F9|nr:excitatory amino acid transporter-like [Mizuhopecten yessoensis]
MENHEKTPCDEDSVQTMYAPDGSIDTMSICENDDEDDTIRQSCLRRNALLVFVAIGVAAGFGLGFGLRSADLSADAIMWLGLPGELFMNVLKMTIIPLIVGSIIAGTATSDPRSNGRISILSLAFIVATNLFGAVMGITAYFILRLGGDITNTHVHSGSSPDSQHLQTQDMFADLLRNIVPNNIITPTFQKAQTRYTSVFSVVDNNGTNVTVQVFVRHVGVASTTNVLGVILISAVVGLAASTVKESSTSFVPFFTATSDIFIRIMRWFVWSTPVGVASLICVSIIRVENLEDTFRSLGMFLLTFTVGNLLQQLLLIPSIYFLALRKNPFTFLLSTARPWMTVFGPPSSIVGMPDMITVCEETHHVDKRVSSFAIPFSVTLCRAGSCYFISLSALFMYSMEGLHPSVSDVILIGILTTLSSLAIPSIPSGSIVAIIIILSSLNIDTTSVGVLMALEWYTDRMRTGSNMLHMVTCTIVVDKLCAPQLQRRKLEENGDVDDTTHI